MTFDSHDYYTGNYPIDDYDTGAGSDGVDSIRSKLRKERKYAEKMESLSERRKRNGYGGNYSDYCGTDRPGDYL